MDIESLLPYTHVYTTATCPKVIDHLIELASLAAPVRLTTFVAKVNEAAKKHRGTITGVRKQIILSDSASTISPRECWAALPSKAQVKRGIPRMRGLCSFAGLGRMRCIQSNLRAQH